MNSSNEKISVRDYARSSIASVRNKIIFFGGILIIPTVVLAGFYFEYSSLSQTLIPVVRQMAQAISIGDEIALQRITDSLALIPQVSSVRVYLEDGTCAAESEKKDLKNNWSSSIQEPCSKENSPFELSIEKKIESVGTPVNGVVHLSLNAPWNYILFIPILFLLLIFIANLFIKLSVQKLVLSLVQVIDSLSTVFEQKKDPNFEFTEIDAVYKKLLRLKSLELEMSTNISLQKAASQVSHDIRSPLSALEMILPILDELPEQKRLIVRNSVNRIRDIANDLLRRYKIGAGLDNENNELENELLMPLVESIVSEKRIEFKNLIHTEILFSQSRANYGLFSPLIANDLKRVISNLINNAVEALPNAVGKVSVELSSIDNDWIQVAIQDNGVGISSDRLKKIGKLGASFDKVDGSGLGLHSAIEQIQKWGGNLLIESKEHTGTVVKIRLKRVDTPSWFVPQIVLTPQMTIIALDDDNSIHRIWQDRLNSLHIDQHHIELRCFSKATELQKFYRENFAELDKVIYLIDYEIIGSDETGLDLIERLGIQMQSILVTSRYEEPFVRTKCDQLKVRLIPKSMSGFVPMKIGS